MAGVGHAVPSVDSVSPPHAVAWSATDSTSVEVSVVMPCLNEADTLGICIDKARRALDQAGLAGEIIVADNGSTDGSRETAQRMQARLVDVPAKGYGNALMGGISAAR